MPAFNQRQQLESPMRINEAIPTPEVIAKEIAVSRRERALLRRLYRLSLDVRAVSPDLRDARVDTDTTGTSEVDRG